MRRGGSSIGQPAPTSKASPLEASEACIRFHPPPVSLLLVIEHCECLPRRYPRAARVPVLPTEGPESSSVEQLDDLMMELLSIRGLSSW